MPVTPANPLNGDDLTAQSITVNVTDRIIAWAASHETGVESNGAVRHTSDQMNDAALAEVAVPSNGASDVHARLDMIARTLSDMMGTGGTGFSGKRTTMLALQYPSLAALNVAAGGVVSPLSDTVVRRDGAGKAFATGLESDPTGAIPGVNIVAPTGYTGSAFHYTLNGVQKADVSSAGDATFAGRLQVGSGAQFVTTVAGLLDLTKGTGLIPIASLPALAGDVSTTPGGTGTTVTVLAVGGKTASQVATSVNATTNASALGAANQLVKTDGAGGTTFTGPVTGTTFVGTLSGVATNITGVLTAASHPALLGDVTSVTGNLATTVAFVGGVSASLIAAGATAANNASSAGAASQIVKLDGAKNVGGINQVTAATFVGALSGTATNISGVLNAASMPALAGDVTSAGGTLATTVSLVGGISATNIAVRSTLTSGLVGMAAGAIVVSGGSSPVTALSGNASGQVPVWNDLTHQWVPGGVAIPDGFVTAQKFAPGWVSPTSPNTMSVAIQAIGKFNNSGIFVQYTGTTGTGLDLSGHVPGATLRRYVLLEVNSTGAIFVKDGPVTSGVPDPKIIVADPDTTPIAFVYLEFGMTMIQSANIIDCRSPSAGNVPGAIGSPVGHQHGINNESRVGRQGIDEFFVTPEATLSLRVVISPGIYRDGTNAMQVYGGGLTSAFTLPSSPNIYLYGVGVDNTGAIVLSSAAISPARPTFPNNTKPLAYVHLPYTATVIKQRDDGTGNGWIEDVRDFAGFGTVSQSLANVAGGGTGQTTFTAGILVSPGGTTAFTTIAAPTSTIVGINDVQTLTNKTLSGAVLSAPTIATGAAMGGTFTGDHTYAGQIQFTNATAPIISASIGPTAARQHALPNIASDTVALIGAAQTFANKTLTAPTINGGALSGTFSGAASFSGAITYTSDVIAPKIGTAAGTGQVTIPAATSDTFALVTLAQTLANKTLASPVISGTVTGTYTLGGTPTINSPTIATPTLNGTPVLGSAAAWRTATGTAFVEIGTVFLGKPPASGTDGNTDWFGIGGACSITQTPLSGRSHVVKVGTNPTTSSAVFNIYKNTTATSVGTITITTAGVVTIAITNTSFAAGDEILIAAPSTQNAALANVRITLQLDY